MGVRNWIIVEETWIWLEIFLFCEKVSQTEFLSFFLISCILSQLLQLEVENQFSCFVRKFLKLTSCHSFSFLVSFPNCFSWRLKSEKVSHTYP